MTHQRMLDLLADRIVALHTTHPLRVAIDGIDASGKTTLADELAPPLWARGRSVIRASVDGFHRPRAERYRRGADSPDGYYYDSFDYTAIRRDLLEPLGPHGSRRYRRAVFDLASDMPLLASGELAPDDAILLFDGVFLLRPELNALWEYRIFVEAPFAVALQRAFVRDLPVLGTLDAVQARYQRRYIPGQRLYLEAAKPQEIAQAIVHNANPDQPDVVFRA
ncbi:MAG TPA: hypothetical protein VMV29_09425 [Ktedonobacterales bacterium]|nr:hypothetical protein [Ktedonobacterales bacterium]